MRKFALFCRPFWQEKRAETHRKAQNSAKMQKTAQTCTDACNTPVSVHPKKNGWVSDWKRSRRAFSDIFNVGGASRGVFQEGLRLLITPPLYMGKAGTIWQFFCALFPSTWRTLSPHALFTRIRDTRKHPEFATFSCFPC